MALIISIFAGGGLGALLRYGVISNISKILPSTFPYGTLTVNILGALLIGNLQFVITKNFNFRKLKTIYYSWISWRLYDVFNIQSRFFSAY